MGDDTYVRVQILLVGNVPSDIGFVSHETESDFKKCTTNESDFGLVQFLRKN
jgi:hypothetical protein